MVDNKSHGGTTGFSIKMGDLLDMSGIRKLERGKKYLDEGRVLSLGFTENGEVKGVVLGEKKYFVTIKTEDDPRFNCSCPSFENDGFCKHCVAVILAAEKEDLFETVSKTYVKRLVGRVSRIRDRVKPNPGDEITHALEEMGGAETGAVGTHGEYQYRQIEKGLVVWGGNATETLLDKFDLLRLKEGFRLDGYYFYDGMGGNFMPVIRPSNVILPDWTDDSRNPVFEPESIPEGLDTEIDSYIIHDQSAKSYFQKSIFLRELHDIGAFWHGCSDWHIRGIVLEKREVIEALKKSQRLLEGERSIPEVLSPKVSFQCDSTIKVSFYFLSGGLGSTMGLFILTDIHSPDGAMKIGERDCIVDMGPGPIP